MPMRAEDLESDEDGFTVTTSVEAFGSVQTALTDAGLDIESGSLVYVPSTTTKLAINESEKVLRLVDALEDHPDVQAVYTTLELDDETISALA